MHTVGWAICFLIRDWSGSVDYGIDAMDGAIEGARLFKVGQPS